MIVGSFANTRARLQRLSDAKFFAGWIESLSNSEVRMRVRDSAHLTPGDACLFEAHGTDSIATFEGTLKIKWQQELVFQLTTPIKFHPAKEDPRRIISGVRATVACDGHSIEAEVLDISAGGMGVLSSQSLARAQAVQMSVQTAYGGIACAGEVRYCKPDQDSPGQYRVGIQFKEMERLDRARWNRLLEKAA